jgi:beta-lactamase class A
MDYGQRRRRLEKSNSGKLIKVIFFLFFAGAGFWFFFQTTHHAITYIAKQQTENIEKEIASAVQKNLQGTPGTFGIVVKDLSSDLLYTYNEQHVFKTASLYKLWVMAQVYKEIQEGKLQKTQELREDVATLNAHFSIASESAEQTEGTIDLSVILALQYMIRVSDNYSALLLADTIGLPAIDSFLQKNGLTQSDEGGSGSDPTSSPYDIALFLQKLYQGKLANKQYTSEMIELLKEQQINTKLPKYLPEDIAIAHKTGELDTFTHDAGIVYTPNGNYIIVVMSESDNPPATEEKIAAISKSVYDFFRSH